MEWEHNRFLTGCQLSIDGPLQTPGHPRARCARASSAGFAPLQAAAVALDVHSSASVWSKALLDNAARPSGAIIYKGADGQSQLTADQYDRLVTEMESHHQGARNAGRPMLLEGGLDWKAMGLSPRDMDFLEARNGAARDIALSLGVPPMLMGIPGDATYANYREANRALWRQTILPLLSVTASSAAVRFAPVIWLS